MLLSLMTLLARAMAMIGGIVLCLLVIMICVSITGRELNSAAHNDVFGPFGDLLLAYGVKPVLGDFELVEAGIAFAIFAFLPLTQLNGAHATVDIFTNGLPVRANRMLIAFWEIVLTLAILLITWRLYAGMSDKMRYGETTYLIQFPIWWAYAASLFAAVVASIVAIYCAVMRVTGQRQL